MRQSSNLNGSSTPRRTSGRDTHVSLHSPTFQRILNSCVPPVLPFSSGARSCIGQRFAVTEMIGIIASVVRRYEIRVPDDVANKPFEEQKEALLKWTTGISLTPVNARVKLCRRI